MDLRLVLDRRPAGKGQPFVTGLGDGQMMVAPVQSHTDVCGESGAKLLVNDLL